LGLSSAEVLSGQRVVVEVFVIWHGNNQKETRGGKLTPASTAEPTNSLADPTRELYCFFFFFSRRGGEVAVKREDRC
jgi:hypothetical protein